MIKKAPQAGAFLLLALCVFVSAQAAEFETVKSITDGDTIKLANGSFVRLIGVNCPEKSRNGSAAEPLALEAKLRLDELLSERRARIVDGKQNRDVYKRRLAYVFTPSGVDVQKELLKSGYCSVVAIPPNLKYIRQYQKAEASAKRSRKGIWGLDYFRHKKAADLNNKNTGFQFVSGKVKRIGQSRKNIYLNLSKRFAIRIPRKDWKQYFSGKPNRLKGKQVKASGWVSQSKRGLQMKVQHPAMFEVKTDD